MSVRKVNGGADAHRVGEAEPRSDGILWGGAHRIGKRGALDGIRGVGEVARVVRPPVEVFKPDSRTDRQVVPFYHVMGVRRPEDRIVRLDAGVPGRLIDDARQVQAAQVHERPRGPEFHSRILELHAEFELVVAADLARHGSLEKKRVRLLLVTAEIHTLDDRAVQVIIGIGEIKGERLGIARGVVPGVVKIIVRPFVVVEIVLPGAHRVERRRGHRVRPIEAVHDRPGVRYLPAVGIEPPLEIRIERGAVADQPSVDDVERRRIRDRHRRDGFVRDLRESVPLPE